MKNLAALATALALILPVAAMAVPGMRHTRLPDAAFEYRLTFPASDTDDSQAMSVRGMCSVTFVVAGSDAVSLYLIPSDSTAATSGTLIGAFTASTTAATTFQSGAMWVKAVATTATTGGSIMRIHCSNEQVASTGEACTTAGLAPYVGDLGGYKCEPGYSYDEDENELSAGSISLDPVAGKNVVRFPGISEFTGPDPDSTSALIYCLSSDQECYVENLDGLNAPSRVVTASPDYYAIVIEWGAAFTDLINEYADLGAAGAQVVQRFCMVKGPEATSEKTFLTSVESEEVVFPMAGQNTCTRAQQATKVRQAYIIVGDPYIQDVWCTSRTNLASAWQSGDEIVFEFNVSNEADMFTTPEYQAPAHTLTYGYDEIVAEHTTLGRHYQLRASVDAFASSFLTETIDGDGVGMMILTVSIESMTRAVGSSWEAVELHCMMGLQFRDTR